MDCCISTLYRLVWHYLQKLHRSDSLFLEETNIGRVKDQGNRLPLRGWCQFLQKQNRTSDLKGFGACHPQNTRAERSLELKAHEKEETWLSSLPSPNCLKADPKSPLWIPYQGISTRSLEVAWHREESTQTILDDPYRPSFPQLKDLPTACCP